MRFTRVLGRDFRLPPSYLGWVVPTEREGGTEEWLARTVGRWGVVLGRQCFFEGRFPLDFPCTPLSSYPPPPSKKKPFRNTGEVWLTCVFSKWSIGEIHAFVVRLGGKCGIAVAEGPHPRWPRCRWHVVGLHLWSGWC